jgi:hypothetical protein
MWYREYELNTWDDVQDHIEKHYTDSVSRDSRWIFRGERLCKIPRTTLEAAFDLYGIVAAEQRKKCEKWIVREFQRKASLYMGSEPHKDDILKWLAVMQHHGGLTRLLDFTYSFYVAIYFALAQHPEGAVWAISVINNSKPLTDKIRRRDSNLTKLNAFRRKLYLMNDILGIRAEGEKLTDLAIVLYLIKYPLASVYPVSPFRLNRRLTAQQGLFLVSGDITKSFEENLRMYFDKDAVKMRASIHKVRLAGDKDKRKEIIFKLKRMNIGNESLFPDLDGFARSTQDYLAFPDMSRVPSATTNRQTST